MDAESGFGRVDLTLRKRPRGEVVVFGKLMAALSTMKAREAMASFDVEVYEDVTVDVPLPMLAQVVSRLASTADVWRPTPGDLLGACEQARLALRASVKFEPCAQCESSPGWVEREMDGVKRLTRCSCWTAHQQKVAALGAPEKPLALPAARTSDFEQIAD